MKEIPVGKGRIIKDGTDLAILSIGPIGNRVKRACNKLEEENISCAHYDMRFVKPLDTVLLHEVAGKFDKIITIEDGTINGGFGSAVLEFLSENNYTTKVVRLGIPDRFIDHGTQAELYKECGFDLNGILESVRELIK